MQARGKKNLKKRVVSIYVGGKQRRDGGFVELQLLLSTPQILVALLMWCFRLLVFLNSEDFVALFFLKRASDASFHIFAIHL